ncbi:MAG: hypothetical protein HDR01_14430 [Lachnospiraceae bacterium]|nr:hypothetical protein [Lachnospiraceae bacterium]
MKKENKERQLDICCFIGFILLIGFICFLSFYKLDAKYVDPWDEARHGVNAYEMYKEGNLIRSTYLYETDYYNLKPPLSMWCIMILFAIFGTNVFALRAYSALCYVILSIAVGCFVKRKYGRLEALFTLGFLAANTTPFIAHMVRAGDADSLYVLLFTLAMLSMLRIEKNQKYLYACGLFFALAFLTKSFHAGVIAVIGGLFLLLTGELKKMSIKTWGLFLGSFVVPIGIWAVPRLFTDGMVFFRQMLYTDVLGRSSQGFGSVEGTFTYYLEYYLGIAGANFPTLASKGTVYGLAALICVAGAVYYNRLFTGRNYKKIIGYLLWIFVPLLAFSAVRTKLLWYMYPVFIPLFMAAGIVAGRLVKEKQISCFVRGITAVCVVVGIGYFSRDVYVQIEEKLNNQQSALEFQDLVKNTAEVVKEAKAYVIYEKEQGVWNQQDVFVAEAYGDYRCRNLEGAALEMKNIFLEIVKEPQEKEPVICFLYKEGYDSIVNALKEAGLEVEPLEESENYGVVMIK